MNLATVILAAGASKRMGMPKQILPIGNKTMIKHIIDEVLELETYPITVVIGANRDKIAPEVADIPINIIVNQHWETGMASSIKMGLIGTYLIEKNIEALLIVTSDMPFVTEKVLKKLIEKATSSTAKIVASGYGKSVGVPALFKREVFNDLLDLSGEEGAKSLFKKYKKEVEVVSFPEGEIDLDTKEDYFNFIQSKN
jgi:molybdenum cofactor cytidylyltransferase